MNVKRFIGAAIALCLFVFFYEWFVHGYLLVDQYMETPNLWRAYPQMMDLMPIGSLIKFIASFWLAFAFAQLYKQGGAAKGLLFGLFFGIFAGLLAASSYVWLPISTTLAFSWLLNGIVEWLIGGLILGAIYRAKQ